MKKLNTILAIAIVTILLIPGAVVGTLVSACCGVEPGYLAVTDTPDPVCIGDPVTIAGSYSVWSPWGDWTEPYTTGVDITIYDSSPAQIAAFNLALGGGSGDPGNDPGTPYTFSQGWTPPDVGTYTYEVVAWADGGSGRMDTSAISGTIVAEVCNVPPDCSAAQPSISVIWPPNNKFVDVTITGVTDADGDVITITINSIYQDEPVDTVGDGNFSPDGQGVGTATAQVRAERSGTAKVPGDGRVYHIAFTASDGQATCSGVVKVGVPHDVKDVPVDGGALYDSTIE